MLRLGQPLLRTAARNDLMRKTLLGCGIASSILYVATDVIAARRCKGYSYRHQVFSELTAEGAPTRTFMIASNVIPNALLGVAFVGGVRASTGPNRAVGVTAAMLTGVTVASAASGGIFPMEMRGNERTLRNVMHIPATAMMSFSTLASMGFGSRLLGRRFRHYTYQTIAILVVSSALTSLQIGKLLAHEPTPWMGIEERISLYATMLWLAVLAAALLRAERTSTPQQVVGTTAAPRMLPR